MAPNLQFVQFSIPDPRFEAARSIRRAVFQTEQAVDPSLEFDGLDDQAEHWLVYVGEQAVATTRIRYLGDRTAKIERLAVLPGFRGQGIAQQLMEVVVSNLMTQPMEQPLTQIVVHAQAYVAALYAKLGFEEIGDPFQEAGIWHLKMQKNCGAP